MIELIKIPLRLKFVHQTIRYYMYETLCDRSVIQISGDDSKSFLQGLMSNDVTCVQDKYNSLYSLFLNAKGRVLYDVIVYLSLHQKVFVECDKSVSESLIKHISLYKLRKKVDITKLPDSQISVILPQSPTENIESLIIHDNSADLVYFGCDPRVKSWTIRILTLKNIPIDSLVPGITQGHDQCYLESRLQQGICEGVNDFDHETALPLEFNGDIMYGISFNKGCYIGQELTARTHHTGVVRKRIMPVHVAGGLATGVSLFADEKQTAPVGLVKSCHNNGSGLAIIRLSSLRFDKWLPDGSRQFKPLFFGDNTRLAVVRAPAWWSKDIVLPTE